MASWHNDGDGTGGGGGESYETYPNLAGFPATGETGVLYVAADTGKLYRWTGSAYVVVSDVPAHAVSHGDGGTDEITVAQSQVTGLAADLAGKVPTTRTVNGHALTGDVTVTKADVGLGNVDNTSDANKPVSTAAQAALDAKAPLVRTVGTGLATSGSVTLDFATLHDTIQTITLTGNPTFTTSNLSAGREVTLVLAAGGSARTLSWPSWIAVGAALPTSLASGKTMVVSLTSTSTADGAVIAAAAVQP